ncbi:OmpA/MotB family protein [Aquimonas voraii]|uniref:Chemotaxis protein MotB n=1 Tax=Aquimonas voraii TaxID=265719 RepID=A0A1G6VE55_9GAMM|nr:OmpA family protein [Aquimonas voraii]SDD51902.1 chemotaxis protein MotB [Aquimonas voraii]
MALPNEPDVPAPTPAPVRPADAELVAQAEAPAAATAEVSPESADTAAVRAAGKAKPGAAPARAALAARKALPAGAAAALLDAVADDEGESEGWLITYLDMITLLLVMMVVMLAFAGKFEGVGEASEALARQSGTAAPVELPLPTTPPETMAVPDLGEDIEVLVKDKRISFRISSEILFESGQADLSLGGLTLLRRLLPVLRESPHPIAVHGHTDAVPIRSARFPSNWELSGARAGSVVRYFEANGIDKQRLRAVGFADTRPLADNASAEGRASNRRVELVLEQPAD